jgi:predicted secreted protein
MNWFTGILVYIIVWWMVLFTVLPWGVRPPAEPGPGHATSAPERPRMWLKAGVTSLIAAVIWLFIYLALENRWISLEAA